MAQKTLDENKKLPWQVKSLKDISLINAECEYMKNHSYIAKSQCVGSAMDTKQMYYSDKINKVLEIGQLIQDENFIKAKEIMDAMNYSAKEGLKNNIFAMRKKLTVEPEMTLGSTKLAM